MEQTLSLITRLIDIRMLHAQVMELEDEIEYLETKVEANTHKDYSSPVQQAVASLKTIKGILARSTISSLHPLRQSVKVCNSKLSDLASLDKKPTSTLDVSTCSHSSNSSSKAKKVQ